MQVSFKNCALLTKCITKIYGATIDDAENLYLVMPMYNLLEHSSNYSETIGSMWFHLTDEAANFDGDNANKNFKCCKYKAKLLENPIA